MTRSRARRGWLRATGLAAFVGMTGTAYAATSPTATQSRATAVTLAGAGSRDVVRYGQPLRLTGIAARAQAGRSVRLEFAPSGRDWRPVAQVATEAGGSYLLNVRARQSGAYRAVNEDGASPRRRVVVAAGVAGGATRHARRGQRVAIRGALLSGVPRRIVRIELGAGRRWRAVARARTSRGGRFRAIWRAGGAGSYKVRVRFAGDRLNARSAGRLRGRVHVYRPGAASWYGPGLYGNRLGCGGTLGVRTLGVAHRTLPCGTRVTLRYRGRSVTVPVVDRGPFHGGREWDLTGATKERLGFPSTGTVWTTR